MFKNCIVYLTLLLSFSIALPAPSEAEDYFIAEGAADDPSCGSSVSPCATVQYVLNNKVETGDTIRIFPGEYSAPNQIASGSHINIYVDNITITAQDQNDRPLFVGDNDHHLIFRIRPEADDVTLSYLRIRSSTTGYSGGFAGPVFIEGERATVEHCELSYGGTVVLFRYNIKSHRITNNHIHHGCWDGACSGQQDCHLISLWDPDNLATSWNERVLIANNIIEYAYGDGLQFAGNVAYIEIANNTFRFFGENAIDFKGVNHLRIYGNDISYGCQRENILPGTDACWNQYDLLFATKDNNKDEYEWYVYNNNFHDNAGGAIGTNDGDGRVDNWYIWNNAFYNLCQWPLYATSAVNVHLVSNACVTQNTFYNVRETYANDNHITGVYAGNNGDRIQNNIFFNVGDDEINDDGAIRSTSLDGNPTYNYIYSINRQDADCAGNCHPPDETDITDSDPGFVSDSGYDFRLISNSPNRDKGVNLSNVGDYTPDLDRDGNARDTDPDLGAYQFLGSTYDHIQHLMILLFSTDK